LTVVSLLYHLNSTSVAVVGYSSFLPNLAVYWATLLIRILDVHESLFDPMLATLTGTVCGSSQLFREKGETIYYSKAWSLILPVLLNSFSHFFGSFISMKLTKL